MPCPGTNDYATGSRLDGFPSNQQKKQKRLSDIVEKRSRIIESHRDQKSKSEGYRPLYKETCYLISSFPRLFYYKQLIYRLTTKIRAFRPSFKDFAPISAEIVEIYLAGENTEETKKLITSCKEEPVNYSLDAKQKWPVSALIYFQSENEYVDKIEELIDSIRPAMWTKTFIVLNKGVRPSAATDESKYQVLCRKKKCVREALSSFLETPLKEYIEKFLEEFNSGVIGIKIEEIPDLWNECKSLLSQMSPERNETRIPENIKSYLFERPGVYGFGIWGTSEFKVFIGNSPNNDRLQSDLYELSPKFFDCFTLHIVSGEIKMNNYLKQGDKVCIDKNCDNSQYSCATVGALLKDDESSGEIYGLTCRHVLPSENKLVYVESPETTELYKVGECIYSDANPHFDFAVFQIDKDEKRNCDTTFLNRMEKPCNVNVYEGPILPYATVHKKGATTNLTDGKILSPEFYSTLFEDRSEMFLVSNVTSPDHPFSAQGDSGSVVFQHDRSPDQRTVFALGVVTGGINEVREENLTDFVDSTVCLRLNKALSRFSDKKQLHLEFETSCRTSSSSDDSV